jgi:serine/threonine protein kinase
MALNLKPETVVTGEPAAAAAPRTPEELAPHFPQLEILECLGRGGMGVVYKARQPQLDRVVALKILAPERVTEARFADRFLREARALAKLNHPNIVAVHDFGQTGGYFYLVMEFVDGVNLRELLRGGRLPPAEALAIVPAICDALQYAHDRGIVHRDIKPENILIDKEGKVKIADFGIAKMIEAEADGADLPASAEIGAAPPHGPTGVVGTPKYMAPEQAYKPGAVDHRADIYSLGVVFYEMLTGELPGKLLEAPSKKVQIDVRLDEVVLRALERKPEMRFQQAGDVKTMVETIAQTGETGGGINEAKRHEFRDKILTMPDPANEPTGLWQKLRRHAASSHFTSPEAREIAAHMTDAEWEKAIGRGQWFGLWYMVILFAWLAVPFLARSASLAWPLALALAVLAVLAGIAAYPVWYKRTWDMLCSTEWASAQGISPASRPKFYAGKENLGHLASLLVPLLAMLAFLTFISIMGNKGGLARIATSAPYVGHFSNGTMELMLMAGGAASNTVCWLADGTPSSEAYPDNLGNFWVAGKEVKGIAFRVHGPSGTPILKFNKETGNPSFSSRGFPDPKPLDAIFTEPFPCPSNLLKMDVQIGLASGPWETLLVMGKSGSEETGDPDGMWVIAVQTTGSGDEVALACEYSVKQDWETRLVAVDANGEAITLRPKSQNGLGANLTSVMASMSRDEFEKVTGFHLQRRKRQWVEFRNVSLEPGYHTKVEILDATPR